jgi:hypothetical protein
MVASVRKKLASGPPRSTYDLWVLSSDERTRFIAALGDGFGFSHKGRDLDEQPLPTTITPGLLQHRVYYDPFRRLDDFSGRRTQSFGKKAMATRHRVHMSNAPSTFICQPSANTLKHKNPAIFSMLYRSKNPTG